MLFILLLYPPQNGNGLLRAGFLNVHLQDTRTLELGRDLTGGDALREALGDGRLADPWSSNKGSTVLGLAAENRSDTVNLVFAANHWTSRLAGYVPSIGAQT